MENDHLMESKREEKFLAPLKMLFSSFQIRIRVLEGRQLPGNNIHPVVRVTVADQQRETAVKRSTNRPVYNQVHFSVFLAINLFCGSILTPRLSPATLFQNSMDFSFVFKSVILTQ